MTVATLDEFLLRLAPGEPIRPDPALLRARDSLRTALSDLRQVPDAALEKSWPWRGEQADVRHGLYSQYETLEQTRAEVQRLLADLVRTESPARPLVASATAARWDLHGLLAGLVNEDLDRDTGNGEWTVRQTLAHIVNGQRAYGWFTAWWLARDSDPQADFPRRVPEEVAAELPAEDTDGVGSIDEIGRRLDDILDLSAGVLGSLTEAQLRVPARWSGTAVNVGFRINRWSSHLREHTIQIEKTLEYIGHQTTEVERLLRLIAAAYGRLEEDTFMSAGDRGAAEAAERIELALAGIAQSAATVPIAASA